MEPGGACYDALSRVALVGQAGGASDEFTNAGTMELVLAPSRLHFHLGDEFHPGGIVAS
jgi:hypothetical protein